MQKLRRFARFWDLIGNSGNFIETTPLVWCHTNSGMPPSPFHAFMRCCEWLHERTGRTDSIALVRLMELLFRYLTDELKHQENRVAESLWCDYQRGGRRDKPAFLKLFLAANHPAPAPSHPARNLPKRQARHGIQA